MSDSQGVVIDTAQLLEQCCEWGFVVELLDDILREKVIFWRRVFNLIPSRQTTTISKLLKAVKDAQHNVPMATCGHIVTFFL
jgi:hypothetical protein